MNGKTRDTAPDSAPMWGKKVKESYGPDDVSVEYWRDLGMPGSYPFTRGIHPGMYRTKLWTMRELAGYGTGQDTRQRLLRHLELGATGVAVIADTITHLGIDPDHPLAEGQLGLRGVPLNSLRDMEELFEGVPIERLRVNIIHNPASAFVSLAQYIAMAEKRGLDISKLAGMVQNHPLTSFWSNDFADRPIDLCLKEAGDVLEYCVKFMPLWGPVSVNSGVIGEQGASAPLEIAISVGAATALIEEGLRRGLHINEVAPRVPIHPTIHVNVFEQVAQYRAWRRLWARLMKEKYGVEDPAVMRLRMGVYARGSNLYAAEPLTNIIRITLQAVAAALGGVQSIMIPGYDEAFGLPSDEAQLIALRTQQIVAYESGIANVADALGGSFYVEYLTQKFEEEAREIMQVIDDMGGILEAIKCGWVDEQLTKANIDYYQSILTGKEVAVGVNAFCVPGRAGREVEPLRVSPEVQSSYLKRFAELKATRNHLLVKQTLARLKEVAGQKDGPNMMPYVIEAVKAYATTGEIFGTVREAMGYPYDPLHAIESPFKD